MGLAITFDMTRKRILVVDDQWENLECVQEFLQPEFDVVVACGGKAAVRFLSEQTFDALVLDLVMPDIDGFAVMKLVKKRFPGLPVLLASGSADLARIATEIGAMDWVSKPVRFPTLPQKLRRLLRQPAARCDV
jgi:CheY-like chemotaxis protein